LVDASGPLGTSMRLTLWSIVFFVLAGWADAEIPHPPPLILTSQENGTEPQDAFSCSGTIYGYVTLPQAQTGKHTIEGIWIGPQETVIQHSRAEIEYPPPGQRTAAVWLRFTKEGTVWNPFAIQNSADRDRLLYDGPWKMEVRWDNQTFARSNFKIHCQ